MTSKVYCYERINVLYNGNVQKITETMTALILKCTYQLKVRNNGRLYFL